MQRREAKSGLRDRKCHQRPKARNDTGENPHRNGLFGAGRRSVVWKDWMVETEGTELPTPHPVIEPVSDIDPLKSEYATGWLEGELQPPK
jgi:hypothetical protein